MSFIDFVEKESDTNWFYSLSLHAVDPCEPDPCNDRGDCRLLNDGTAWCVCKQGCTGQFCDQGE